MSIADQERELHDPLSPHALHAGTEHKKKLRQAAYINALDGFIDNPKPSKLALVLSFGDIADTLGPNRVRRVAEVIKTSMTTALTSGDVEGYEKWFRSISAKYRGTNPHRVIDELYDVLDDNNPVDGLLESLLNSKPEMEMRKRAKQLSQNGLPDADVPTQLALLTAFATHFPGAFVSKKFGPGLQTLREQFLATTDEENVGRVAGTLVLQNDLGKGLRRAFRVTPNAVSAPVWQAIIDNAQKGNVPTNMLEATPGAVMEAVRMVIFGTFFGVDYRSLNHVKYNADETRDFLRHAKADRVRPAQLADVANSLQQVERVRQSDVEAIRDQLDMKVEPLEAKKEKGARVFISTLPLVGKHLKHFADGRNGRIDIKIGRLQKRAEMAEEAARSRAMDRRAHELKQAVRLAASLTMLQKSKSDQLSGFRDTMYLVVQTGLQQAGPVETPRFLAQVANVVGGIRRDARTPLAQPETYQPIMDKPQSPHSHSVNLQALAGGVQRAPEALVGYMLALHKHGALVEVVDYMAGLAKSGDRAVASQMGLVAQAMGAASRQARDNPALGLPAIDLADFDAYMVQNVLNDRFVRGHVKGMNDLTRAREAGRRLFGGRRASLQPVKPVEAPTQTAVLIAQRID